MHRLGLASLIALTPVVAPLGAQSTWPVREGTEVRIETSTNRVFRGSLLDGPSDSIRLRQSTRDSIIAVPVTVVRTYSVLRADRRHGARRGFLIGGGVALGIVAGLTAANTNETAAVPIGLVLALPFALIGGGIGAGVGAALTTPEWSAPVGLHASRPRALTFALSYRF
jgi:hypothetical protein